LDFFVVELERQLFTKKFTAYGAIQLDKELKALIEFLSKDCKQSVRDKFSRLSQICSLLNLEQVIYYLFHNLIFERSMIHWSYGQKSQ
jgi:hypothetical protein